MLKSSDLALESACGWLKGELARAVRKTPLSFNHEEVSHAPLPSAFVCWRFDYDVVRDLCGASRSQGQSDHWMLDHNISCT